MNKCLIRPFYGERAQILAMSAILVTVMLGLTGLVVDAGFFYTERRQAQNAADSAARAAAFVLYFGGSDEEINDAALEYAQENGYEGETVTVNYPPLSGPHTGDANFVEVLLDDDPNTLFIHVLVPGGSVGARGVAGIEQEPGDYALLVLDESACQAYYQEGDGGLTINGGGIMDNSDCEPNGFSKIGSGDLTVDGDIHVHGGSSITGAGSVSPSPEEVYWTVPDPLAGVTPPERGTAMSCPTGGTGTAASPDTCTIGGPQNRTLNPGTYYGGLDLQCVCTITLNPGVYVMSGGGFSKSGQAQVVGDGVMIYVTTNPENPGGDGSPDPFNITGGGTLDIEPIDDEDSIYYGISLWQDAAITSDFYLSGNAGALSGLVYVPGAELDVAGIAQLNGVQIIADRFNARGTASLTLNYTAWVDVATPKVYLVE